MEDAVAWMLSLPGFDASLLVAKLSVLTVLVAVAWGVLSMVSVARSSGASDWLHVASHGSTAMPQILTVKVPISLLPSSSNALPAAGVAETLGLGLC